MVVVIYEYGHAKTRSRKDIISMTTSHERGQNPHTTVERLKLSISLGMIGLLAVTGALVAGKSLTEKAPEDPRYPEMLAGSEHIPGDEDPCQAAAKIGEKTNTDVDMATCIDAASEAKETDSTFIRVELSQDGKVRAIPLG